MEPTSAEMIALAIVLPIIALVVLTLRVIVKRRSNQFGVDDYLILSSMLFLIAIAVCAVDGAVAYGYGKVSHGGNSDSSTMLLSTRKLTVIINWLAPLLFGLAKLSALFFYRHIFRGKVFDIISWAVIVFVILWTIAFFGVVIFQCGTRLDLLWSTGTAVQQNCAPAFNIVIANTATDVATDALILIIPIYWTLQLHMSTAKKWTVCVTFMFGALTLCSSVGRLVAYWFVYPGHNKATNQLGYLTVIAYFLTLESSLTIIACCLPTLGPLIHRKTFGTSSTTGKGLNSSTYGQGSKRRSMFSRSANITSNATETSSSDFILGKHDQYHKLETLVTAGKPNPTDSDREGQITVATVTEYGVDERKAIAV